MTTTTSQTQAQIPPAPVPLEPPQGDPTTTLILAIAFLIKTTAVSIAILLKATKR
ncbi:hypothetical protein H6F89_09885 [Cyanobacteria bacterium FACHB-63]|nr:hypothetical protein [Cyanobacteria bacterium FACHB-63]